MCFPSPGRFKDGVGVVPPRRLFLLYLSGIRKRMSRSNFRIETSRWKIWALVLILGSCANFREPSAPQPPSWESLQPRLALETTSDPESGLRISKGTFQVYENRDTQQGRKIHLKVVILHAKAEAPRPDPVFYLAGGPGQAAAEMGRYFHSSPLLEERDIVLVNQRGTGGDNFIDVEIGRASCRERV